MAMKNFRHPQRPKKSSLITGWERVLDALKSGKPLDRIYLDNKKAGDQLRELKALASQYNVPINYVPAAKLNSFNVSDHDGLIALVSKVQYQDLQDVISLTVEKGETPLFLMLDGITDIRNIGGIARSAFCMGAQAIIIPDKGVGALNEDAILTSAGALEKISICRVNSLMKAVDELHMNGIRVFASEMRGGTPLHKADLTQPSAIVMGSEEKGIYPALLKICDERLSIPMPGDFESLNVSVATGMILYEATRQRMS